ncbi:MAG TPA: GNAT family N-acetyltransferase [Povalibacter sp.]
MSHEYVVTTDKHCFDIPAIHAYLTRSYWSPGIPLSTVQKAIDNSLCFALLCEREQVGFARVTTDRATFAYLADVYVLEAHRGRGLAKRLMDAVIQHPDLQGLRRFMLATRDAHTLYGQYGFRELASPASIMEIVRPDVYQSGEVTT